MFKPEEDSSKLISDEEYKSLLAKASTAKYELWRGSLVLKDLATYHHQAISSSIEGQLWQQLYRFGCKPCHEAPLHLRYCEKTYYIPDILVLCGDAAKHYGTAVEDTPTLVIEIWSPSNDWVEIATKEADYFNSGVEELWELDATRQRIFVKNRLSPVQCLSTFKEGIDSIYFPGLHIDLSEFC